MVIAERDPRPRNAKAKRSPSASGPGGPPPEGRDDERGRAVRVVISELANAVDENQEEILRRARTTASTSGES